MKNNSVLIHCCCAHCTAYTVKYWRSQGYELSAFWYNPNIHPFTEHRHRLEAMQSLAKELEFPLVINDSYDMIEYFNRVTGHEDQRCLYCFRLRLEKTAETALKQGFSAFTSSLFISPHQKHDLLLEIGRNIAVEKGIDFLDTDLRKHYSDSRSMTKPLGLYRQQYCGCIYSEWERFAEENK
jgi:predicted adenine nucleotide alpha hydrolase (AANH) superfamily ATPase